jgi:hypothetical protein
MDIAVLKNKVYQWELDVNETSHNGLCCLENKYDNRYLELDYLEMDVNEKEILSHCHNDFWCFQNINING